MQTCLKSGFSKRGGGGVGGGCLGYESVSPVRDAQVTETESENANGFGSLHLCIICRKEGSLMR